MNGKTEQPGRGRIVLALEQLGLHRGAAGLAVRLARELDAELAGVFIEDLNLLRAAGLPFTQEIAAPGGEARRLTPDLLERRQRQLTLRMQAELAEQAEAEGVRMTFRTASGVGSRAALGLRLAADVLVLGRGSRARRAPAASPVILVGDAAGVAAPDLDALLRGLPALAVEHLPLEALERMMRGGRPESPALLVLPAAAVEAAALDALLDLFSCPVLLTD